MQDSIPRAELLAATAQLEQSSAINEERANEIRMLKSLLNRAERDSRKLREEAESDRAARTAAEQAVKAALERAVAGETAAQRGRADAVKLAERLDFAAAEAGRLRSALAVSFQLGYWTYIFAYKSIGSSTFVLPSSHPLSRNLNL